MKFKIDGKDTSGTKLDDKIKLHGKSVNDLSFKDTMEILIVLKQEVDYLTD